MGKILRTLSFGRALLILIEKEECNYAIKRPGHLFTFISFHSSRFLEDETTSSQISRFFVISSLENITVLVEFTTNQQHYYILHHESVYHRRTFVQSSTGSMSCVSCPNR